MCSRSPRAQRHKPWFRNSLLALLTLNFHVEGNTLAEVCSEDVILADVAHKIVESGLDELIVAKNICKVRRSSLAMQRTNCHDKLWAHVSSWWRQGIDNTLIGDALSVFIVSGIFNSFDKRGKWTSDKLEDTRVRDDRDAHAREESVDIANVDTEESDSIRVCQIESLTEIDQVRSLRTNVVQDVVL